MSKMSLKDREALQRQLAEDIQRTLPHLSEDSVNAVTNVLIDKGVKKMVNIRSVQISMLEQVLDSIDSIELHREWQNKYNAPSTSSVSSSGSQPSSQPSTSQPSTSQPPTNRVPLQEAAQAIISSTIPAFNVESPLMPFGVKEAIKAKNRPTARDRRLFVENIVDLCRSTPNFDRPQFEKIAKQIATDFPESFKDSLPANPNEISSDGLWRQLKNRYDNFNRPLSKRTATEMEAPALKQAFGSKSWNPPLPVDQTIETQEVLRRELKAMHKVSRRDWKWQAIKSKLDESFYLQRKEINGTLAPTKRRKRQQEVAEESVDEPDNLTISELHDHWPFLFCSKGINYHFMQLTGVDFRTKLTDYFDKEGSELVDFLYTPKEDEIRRIKRNMTKAEKEGRGYSLMCGALLMLICHLKDDKDALLTLVEKTTTVDDAKEDNCEIKYPEEKTPFLIFAGESVFDFERIFFSADGKVLSTVRCFPDAIELLFCSYFAFNYLYATKLSGLLLFIQRAITQLNTTSGTKYQNSVVHKRCNDRVTSLLNKFADFKQKNKDDDEKENQSRRR